LINPYPLFTLNHLTTPVTFVAMISLLLLAGLDLSLGGVAVPPFVPSTPKGPSSDEDKFGEDLSLSLLIVVVVVAVSAMVLVGDDVKDVERCC